MGAKRRATFDQLVEPTAELLWRLFGEQPPSRQSSQLAANQAAALLQQRECDVP
jgi:hypothetical protein